MTDLTTILQSVPTHLLANELERRNQHMPHNVQRILAAVALAWQTSMPATWAIRSRAPNVCQPRQAAMVLMRRQNMSFPSIAKVFDMAHRTVQHAVRTHDKRMRDADFRRKFEASKKTTNQQKQ